MLRKIALSLALCFAANVCLAAASPVDMLQKTANQLIAALQKNQKQIKNNSSLVNSLVVNIVLPHIDQERMARSVVSRSAWDNASAAERTQFMGALRNVVMRTYSAAFSHYTNEKVEFSPLRGGGNDIEVRSNLVREGKPSIPITYRVGLKNATWKIYDFSVEGVSMVQSFRSQLMSASNQGLAKVTQQLQNHTRNKK